MTGELTIERGGAGDVPSLRSLWLAMHHHHENVMPQMSPYVSDDGSWAVRSRIYATALAQPRSVLLLAREAGDLVGYALGVVLSAEEKAWLDDTWSNTGSVGEIESLAVAAHRRGAGIGSRLLRLLEAELRALGARDLILGVLPGNEDAIRLYARFGYQPTWLYLSKLEGRG